MAKRFGRTQLAQNKTKANQLNFSAWIEIDLDALERNLKEIQKHTKALICPVLKGDAYGHGAPVISAFLGKKGFPFLGVNNLEEALEIIPFTSAKILLLTPPLLCQLPLVLRHKLIATVSSAQLILEMGHLASVQKQRVTLHLKVDTGLGRLGVNPGEVPKLAQLIKKNPYLKLAGVFTHFSDPQNSGFTSQQLKILLEIKDKLTADGWTSLLWHAANSGAFLCAAASHLDLVRLGTLLYGQAPLKLDRSWNLQNTWSFRTRLIQIKQLPPGHPVGYGLSYRTGRPTIVGVIPIGYKDGLELEPRGRFWRQIKQAASLALKQKRSVYPPGKGTLPILGRIGMGLTCLDLTDYPQLEVGDELTVAMRRTTADRGIPKVYFQNGEIKHIYWAGKILGQREIKCHLKDPS